MKHTGKKPEPGQVKPSRCQVNILKERCKGCLFCIEFCPRQVLHESPEFNRKGYHPVYADSNSDCLKCGLCELLCPEFAIHIGPVEEEAAHD
jgi:2-oxoglutarate ferredoxin oxidoreductase subunit delta